MIKLKQAKYFVFIFFLILTLFSFSKQSLARENISEPYISDFSTEIKINLDSSVDISEVIVTDFSQLDNKHGIFRIFPTNYKTDDGDFILPTKLLSITDQDNNAYKYTKSKDGDTVSYQIGNKNVEVQGENVYVINYKVENVVRTERNSYDELYYNILGNFWDMEIDNFRAKIIFPEGINKSNTDLDYYSGLLGDQGKLGFNYIWLSENELEFRSTNSIDKMTGLTLSASFPKDIVSPYKYSLWQRFIKVVNDTNLKYILSLLIILIPFFIWFKFGRDPKINNAIIAEYEPVDDLSPIEMGGILKRGNINKNSISATLINLAVNGYLKIEKIEKKGLFSRLDYKFIKQDKGTDNLYTGEKTFLNNLFISSGNEVLLSELKNSDKLKLPLIFSSLKKDLLSREIINKKGKIYSVAMILVAMALFLIFGKVSKLFSIVSFFSFIGFAIAMNSLSKKGAELKHKILGFKLYMTTAEKYRSRFQEKEGIMEKFLPYAILFGITKQWLKAMKNIYGEEYMNNHSSSFLLGAASLSSLNELNGLITSISSSINSHVSSSSTGSMGSGSSGGGAGGGGGGSW